VVLPVVTPKSQYTVTYPRCRKIVFIITSSLHASIYLMSVTPSQLYELSEFELATLAPFDFTTAIKLKFDILTV